MPKRRSADAVQTRSPPDGLLALAPSAMPFQEALVINMILLKATFSGDKRFIPLLCKHLNDPSIREDDTGASPAREAAQALNTLVNHASPDKVAYIEDWKRECKK